MLESFESVYSTLKSPVIRIRTEVTDYRQVVIRIADNGSGIPKDIQKRLFDPFFTTKPVVKGTGLGLSISYQIVVEKHCGQLQCISTIKEGTEFLITIPVELNS
ncbi:MAG: ATP-binding protein [Nostoc sp. DedQUE09]|nr:ATP-binding protein [Nostoc sp. DedQUE09]MDZ7951477.1 ATP-binding protein [Nostoc sp. DedQUE09]